ncbi:MAG: hypothetical protein ACE14V_04220 [bacterium]
MRYHIIKSYVIQIDSKIVIPTLLHNLISLNIQILEQTESQLRFKYSGNFLRATHPIAWIADGLITVNPEPSRADLPFSQIIIQINFWKIRLFLVLFPIILAAGLTFLSYTVLGSSFQQILQALGLFYLLVLLSMILAYIFVRQILIRFTQTICEALTFW